MWAQTIQSHRQTMFSRGLLTLHYLFIYFYLTIEIRCSTVIQGEINKVFESVTEKQKAILNLNVVTIFGLLGQCATTSNTSASRSCLRNCAVTYFV